MRISFITETFPPEINGVSLTVERAVRHLRAQGHELQLVRPRQPHERPLERPDEWRTAGGAIPMYPALRYGWAAVGALRRRWRARRPELVHAATPGPLAWAALRAARAEGIATSAEFRTNFHAYSHAYGLGWLEPWLLGYLRRLHAMADCSFVPTDELLRWLRERGFAGLHLLGRGVDGERFSPGWRDARLRAAWGAADDDPVLLHVGRLAAEKNVELALDAFEALRREAPRLRMVVVGDGPRRPVLERAHPAARFVGMQAGFDLSRCYASADLFLFPSRTETFGNVTLEALASGLPVVAFDLAAARVHVRRGVCGLLVADGDAAGFVSAARWALAHAAPHSRWRLAAREAALDADWPSVLRAFEQQLQAVVARAGVSRAVAALGLTPTPRS